LQDMVRRTGEKQGDGNLKPRGGFSRKDLMGAVRIKYKADGRKGGLPGKYYGFSNNGRTDKRRR